MENEIRKISRRDVLKLLSGTAAGLLFGDISIITGCTDETAENSRIRLQQETLAKFEGTNVIPLTVGSIKLASSLPFEPDAATVQKADELNLFYEGLKGAEKRSLRFKKPLLRPNTIHFKISNVIMNAALTIAIVTDNVYPTKPLYIFPIQSSHQEPNSKFDFDMLGGLNRQGKAVSKQPLSKIKDDFAKYFDILDTEMNLTVLKTTFELTYQQAKAIVSGQPKDYSFYLMEKNNPTSHNFTPVTVFSTTF